LKPLYINRSIYELTGLYPELIDIMVDLGFKDMANPFTRKTAGKVMTLKKGCNMKGIDFDIAIKKLNENGFEVIQ
jgi:uncharacterized protein